MCNESDSECDEEEDDDDDIADERIPEPTPNKKLKRNVAASPPPPKTASTPEKISPHAFMKEKASLIEKTQNLILTHNGPKSLLKRFESSCDRLTKAQLAQLTRPHTTVISELNNAIEKLTGACEVLEKCKVGAGRLGWGGREGVKT